MIYPIVAYGDPILKKRAEDIDPSKVDIKELVENMYETMYNANGVGLAGPQVGLSLRIFVVDAEPMDEEHLKGFKKVFINPVMIEELGEEWYYEEGCLSIPKIHENVKRRPSITIEYLDEDMIMHKDTYDGMAARVIQHEYDHIEGKLFTDHLNSLKKRMLKGKLATISRGKVDVDYPMKFPRA